MRFLYNFVDTFLNNNSEKDFFHFIENNSNKIIFDIGSFRGSFTKKILKIDKNRKQSKYFLFDPNPKGKIYLKNLMHDNQNIFFNCIGLNDKIEDKMFHLNNFFEASGSSFQTIAKEDKLWNITRKIVSTLNFFNLNSDDNFKSFKVKTDTIDNYCELNKIEKIDLLKIDAEGHEEFILKGGLRMISNNLVKLIYVEIFSIKNEFDAKKNKIADFLKLNNFKFIKEYPIRSVGVLSNLKAADFLFVNPSFKSDNH